MMGGGVFPADGGGKDDKRKIRCRTEGAELKLNRFEELVRRFVHKKLKIF